ncbi:MAG: acetyltransferase [Rhodobacteraceae bacterium]|nr:acetyltransferase [Paracoccaceae bacterium]
MTDASTDNAAPQDFGWVLLELMGHRQRIGEAREEYVGSGKMIRIDIPTGTDGDVVTEFYGTNAVYSLRPISEEVARDHWASRDPRPVRPAEYRPASQIDHYDDDHDEDPY